MKNIRRIKKGNTTIPCIECDGTGEIDGVQCVDCKGTGILKVTLEEQNKG